MKVKKLILSVMITIFTTLVISTNVYADEKVIPSTVETNSDAVIANLDETLIEENIEAEEQKEMIEEDTDVESDDLVNLASQEESPETEVSDVAEEANDEEIEEAEEIEIEETEEIEVIEEKNYTKEELRLLSCIIYAEAGNQSYNGKLAVANIILNRVKSNVFYHVNTIKEVIYDSKWCIQFSVIKEGNNGTSIFSRTLDMYDTKNKLDNTSKKKMNQCIKAAKAALNGENNIGNYLYFRPYSSSIADKYSEHIVIGGHIFYNTK